VNTWETVTFLARKMHELNIKPEIEAFDVGFIQQGVKLAQMGLVKEPAHFQFVMGVDGGIPATVDNLLHMCRQFPSGSTFSVAGVGKSQLSITTSAIVLGGHVRVGLEDNVYYAKGELAPNEEFVARVRKLAELLQREVASPEEARNILGLKTTRS
jgi:3-keto-5-aminohexanoate cleavage enzyme